MILSSFIVTVAILSSGYAKDGYLPPYITPCEHDNNFVQCAKEQIELTLPHFVKGIPELGVPSLDPFHMDDITIDGNGLKLMFSDIVMRGLTKTKVVSFELNLDTEELRLVIVSNGTLDSKYAMDGKILILQVKGEGNANIVLYGSEIDLRAKMSNFKDANGGEHFKLTSTNYNHKVDKAEFSFTNLFGGNQQLSEVTHKFANENWKQIMDDVAPPAVKQVVKTGVKAINKFFSQVTISQIVKNYKRRN